MEPLKATATLETQNPHRAEWPVPGNPALRGACSLLAGSAIQGFLPGLYLVFGGVRMGQGMSSVFSSIWFLAGFVNWPSGKDRETMFRQRRPLWYSAWKVSKSKAANEGLNLAAETSVQKAYISQELLTAE